MKLRQLFPYLELKNDIIDKEIRGLSDDSRQTLKGDLFFVREGEHFDIFSVLRDVEDKAVAFVAEVKLRQRLKRIITRKPLIFVNDIKGEFKRAVDHFCGYPAHSLTFIGVTGTNGKTTTASLIYHLLKKLGRRVSLIGTINYYIGDRVVKALHTTPDYLTLHKLLKEIKAQGCEYVVLEVSSHGISQGRVNGIEFSRCVFTNLSRDHLDYHKTMSNYFHTKRKWLLANSDALSFINIDDAYGRRLLKEIKKGISYGFNPLADIRAKNILFNSRHMRFQLKLKGECLIIDTSLIGRHNVLNIVAAVGVVSSLGVSTKHIARLILSFKGVEGRLNEVAPRIFIDYAHTPDALESALTCLREIGFQKVLCVFGCGGDRDRGKRKMMGSIACRHADFTLITSDNPRSEEPLAICREIEQGFSKKNYAIVVDRKCAINQAIHMKADKGLGVLIAGKGHEDYQIIGDKKIHFKDSEVVREILRKKRR